MHLLLDNIDLLLIIVFVVVCIKGAKWAIKPKRNEND